MIRDFKMRVIQDDLEVMVMYCGEPTIDCCIESIDRQTLQPSRITVIEDVSPISKAINTRHENMQKPFSIKVDADCILYKDCFKVLYHKMIEKGDYYYATSVMTIDPFVGIEGGIQLERSSCLKNLVVPDIIGVDRFIRNEMESKGYKFYEINKPFAEHWSDWSWEQVFKKSMRIGQKHLYYKAKRHNWVRRFAKKWLGDKNGTAFLAILGYCYGLLTLDDKEKGIDFASEEIEIVKGLLKNGIIPEPDELLTLKKEGAWRKR